MTFLFPFGLKQVFIKLGFDIDLCYTLRYDTFLPIKGTLCHCPKPNLAVCLILFYVSSCVSFVHQNMMLGKRPQKKKSKCKLFPKGGGGEPQNLNFFKMIFLKILKFG